jgi:toxin ParE1/3/4
VTPSPSIIVRPRARRDLNEIADYISQDSVEAGRRFYAAAQEAFQQLVDMPGIGRVREVQNPQMIGVRSWSIHEFSNYLVFYRPTATGIEVLRVLHGARDIERILEGS